MKIQKVLLPDIKFIDWYIWKYTKVLNMPYYEKNNLRVGDETKRKI